MTDIPREKGHASADDVGLRARVLTSGWPSWLWWLGRIANRHQDPFTGRWHLRSFGGK